MNLDIRVPIGLLFLSLGGLLAGFGIVTIATMTQLSFFEAVTVGSTTVTSFAAMRRRQYVDSVTVVPSGGSGFFVAGSMTSRFSFGFTYMFRGLRES